MNLRRAAWVNTRNSYFGCRMNGVRSKGFPWLWTILLLFCLALGVQSFANVLSGKVSDEDSFPRYPVCPEKIEPENLPLFYPNLMAIDSTSGQVTVRFVIHESGETSDIVILSSSGGRNERSFRTSARKMVENRIYLPIKNSCEHSETIKFDMDG